MYVWYSRGVEKYISTRSICLPTGFSTTLAIVCAVALPCDAPRSQERVADVYPDFKGKIYQTPTVTLEGKSIRRLPLISGGTKVGHEYVFIFI